MRLFKLSFRFIIGLSLLSIIIFSIDFDDIKNRTFTIHYGIVTLLVVASLADRVLMALKWRILLTVRGIFIKPWQAIKLYFIGHFMGTFTPGGIGADAYRVISLSSFKKTSIVASSVLLERGIGLLVTVLFALAALPISSAYFGTDSKKITVSVIFAAIVLTIGLIISFNSKVLLLITQRLTSFSHIGIIKKVLNLYKAYVEYLSNPRVLFIFFSLTVLELLLIIFINYLAAQCLGLDVSFLFFLCVMPLLHLLLRLPISFSGIGVQEGLFIFVMIKAGFSPADGVTVSLVLRLCEIITVLIPASLMFWLIPVKIDSNTS